LNKYDFTNLVKSPKNIGEADIEKLKALVSQFPYFSIGQNLLVKALHNTHHYDYDKFLKQAALQAGNRSVLYNLVHDLPLETDSELSLNQSVESLQFQPNEMRVMDEIVDSTEEKKEIELPRIESIEAANALEISKIEPIEEKIEIELPKIDPIEVLSSPKLVESPVLPEPIFKPIEQPKTVEIDKDPTIIYEDEKLVNPTGDFEKFVPKVIDWGVDEYESLITIGDENEEVLSNFDISSLDSFVPPRPIIEQAQDIVEVPLSPIAQDIEITKQELSSIEPLTEVTVKVEENLIGLKEEITLAEPKGAELVEPADENFLKWLSNKEDESIKTGVEVIESLALDTGLDTKDLEDLKVNEVEALPKLELTQPEITEEVILPKVEAPKPMVEDETFVFDFNLAISQKSNSKLSNTIQEHLEKPSVLADPILEVEHKPEVKTGGNPLQSLIDYEVNEYLAPLYRQVSYNENLFENEFVGTYGGKKAPEFDFDQTFVRLKALPNEQEIEIPKISKPEIKIEQKAELSREEILKVANQYNVVEAIEQKSESKNREPLVQPKIAEMPAPKIARDPSTVESILDKFIRENPSIARPKSEFYSPVNMAKQSAEESAEIVSETLAQIYTRQGLYKKAIVMYEKLGLHYPDKFTYFAGLISQIKSAHNIE
jgi:hypothetical protein